MQSLSSRSRLWSLLGILVALAAFGGRPGLSAAETKAPPQEIRDLLLKARAELEAPGTDVKAAAQALDNAEGAFAFVRDEIHYVSYAGCFGGAEGTLRTRTANATDKAVLLAALLQALGHKARFARSDWPAGVPPHRAEPKPGKGAAVAALNAFAAKHAKDFAGDQKPFLDAARDRAHAESAALAKETTTARAAIKQLLAQQNCWARLDGAGAEAAPPERDWVWVQAQINGDAWTDFDPVFPKQPRPATADTAFQPKSEEFSLSLEALAADGKATPLLNWKQPAAKALGLEVTFAFLPADEKYKSLSEIKALADVQYWKPVLQIGAERTIGERFAPGAGEAPKESSGGGGLFGGGGGLFGQPKKPAAPAGAAAIRLTIRAGGALAPEHNASRVLYRFDKGFDPHELVGSHRLGFAFSAVPGRIVEARAVDELLEAFRLREAAAGAAPSVGPVIERGISVRTASVLNTVVGAWAGRMREGLSTGIAGPLLFLETVQLSKRGEHIDTVLRLDFLAPGFEPIEGATVEDRLGWGLALCAAEGQLLRTPSVNAQLLEKAANLEVVQKPEAPKEAAGTAQALLDDVLAGGGLVIRAKDAPDVAWAIRRSGMLLGVTGRTDGAIAAKGAGARQPNPDADRAKTAGDLFSAVASGAASAINLPSGMLVTGLTWYFGKLAEAYRRAASKLDQVAEAIETGDDSKLNDPATDEYFRNLANGLTSALIAGGLRGYTESVLGVILGPYVPGGSAGAFGLGAGLSLAPLPQVEPQTVEGILRSLAPAAGP